MPALFLRLQHERRVSLAACRQSGWHRSISSASLDCRRMGSMREERDRTDRRPWSSGRPPRRSSLRSLQRDCLSLPGGLQRCANGSGLRAALGRPDVPRLRLRSRTLRRTSLVHPFRTLVPGNRSLEARLDTGSIEFCGYQGLGRKEGRLLVHRGQRRARCRKTWRKTTGIDRIE